MASIGNQKLTQGWYMTGGIAVGIMFGNTKAAPIILGVLVIALIYQLTNLIEGVAPGQENPAAPGGPATVPTITPQTSSNQGAGSTSATFV